jgi:hypothetical protein
MKKLIAAIALLLTVPALVRAQDADHAIHGQAYFFVASIVTNSSYGTGSLNAGFGGELLLTRDWGVGAELGYVGDSEGSLWEWGQSTSPTTSSPKNTTAWSSHLPPEVLACISGSDQ